MRISDWSSDVCSSDLNVGANRGAIDAVMATVRHDLCQRDGYSLPDPSVAPTPEPSVDCVPVPIFRRNIAPWRAAAEPPKYAVDNQTVLLRTASAPSSEEHRVGKECVSTGSLRWGPFPS